MAGFGVPGGFEIWVIASVVLLLFVPGIVVFGLGYMLGRHRGAVSAAVPVFDIVEVSDSEHEGSAVSGGTDV
ncbi:MAG: hypothetical protein JXA36_07350 [Coriobacteriia bacterium]|nr:hypothetical protein [Coriobacteriia bacterium]